MEYNRNPRLHIPTKVDKVRSEQIIAKQGASRDVGIKAKVVNKIVREASGKHSYVIVPPPRKKGEEIEQGRSTLAEGGGRRGGTGEGADGGGDDGNAGRFAVP